MNKLMRAAEQSKRTVTVGELLTLPNSISHTLFKWWRDRDDYLRTHPKEAKEEAKAKALQDGLLGGTI